MNESVTPQVDTAALAGDVLLMCRRRGWSLHWTHRGAYLHLESSELIEAIRGKGGDPLKEAADVLLVLMSITEYHDIPWANVERQAQAKCEEMMTRPRYAGEEHDGRALG
jgi:NTP pyrophosphatase (non-canonical NTP hydrolase)